VTRVPQVDPEQHEEVIPASGRESDLSAHVDLWDDGCHLFREKQTIRLKREPIRRPKFPVSAHLSPGIPVASARGRNEVQMQRARGLLSQFLRKFIHDGLPVALAGAIGTMLFGQFSRPSAPPPPPAVQQPASDATMELMREEHALVLDLLKRQAEATRVANSAQENALEAKQLGAAADERAARARRASPAKAPPISAAKPIHQKEMAAGDPLPLAPPAPTADNAAAPAVADKPEPAGSSHVIGKLFEWARTAVRLPGRLLGATERLIEDVPGTALPPLGLPGRQLRVAM
jgi:hypothetical protein